VRTFAPTVAGAAEMPYRRFALFNITGGVLWVFSMVLAGYSLRAVFSWIAGREISQEEMTSYLHYVIVVVVFLSLLPAVFEWWRERRRTKAAGPALAGDEPE
jgi:membrane-associated protein